MAGESRFGSNNPFRRKDSSGPAAPPTVSASTSSTFTYTEPTSSIFEPPPPPLSGDVFQKQLQSLPQSSEPPPSTTFQRPKPVKKVRVQSPPPSSPESAPAMPEDYPASGGADDYDSDRSSEEEDEDPFENARSPMILPEEERTQEPETLQHPPPPNPFQKTLKDLEQSSMDSSLPSSPSAGGKGSLDVSSFGRLLLTGQAGVPGIVHTQPPIAQSSHHASHPSTSAGDAGSITDASSISRQSIFDIAQAPQETPRTSHEISNSEDDDPALMTTPKARIQSTPATLRKKPPPPSSRHGKLIKIELKDTNTEKRKSLAVESEKRPGSGSTTSSHSKLSSPSTPSDVNKPLPPAPIRRSTDGEDSESIFDREAAGKVPETGPDQDEPLATPFRPPTPPNISHTRSTSTVHGPKKPVPPPRRNTHGKTENKPPSRSGMTPGSASTTPQSVEEADPAPPRSSLDSTRSRSSSIRVNVNAPAPPPPRRPNHGQRASNSFTSPSAVSFASMTSSASSPSAISDAERSPLGYPAPPVVSPTPPTLSDAGNSMGSAVRVHGANSSVTPGLLPSPASLLATHSQSKLSPPPPPPARNASVRSSGSGRPPSVSSIDAISRRISKDKAEGMAPPPPPPRQRGSSRGSVDAPVLPRRVSGDGVGILGGMSIVEEPVGEALREEEGTGTTEAEEQISTAEDILADLDALRREVDALRGRYDGADETTG